MMKMLMMFFNRMTNGWFWSPREAEWAVVALNSVGEIWDQAPSASGRILGQGWIFSIFYFQFFCYLLYKSGRILGQGWIYFLLNSFIFQLLSLIWYIFSSHLFSIFVRWKFHFQLPLYSFNCYCFFQSICFPFAIFISSFCFQLSLSLSFVKLIFSFDFHFPVFVSHMAHGHWHTFICQSVNGELSYLAFLTFYSCKPIKKCFFPHWPAVCL